MGRFVKSKRETRIWEWSKYQAINSKQSEHLFWIYNIISYVYPHKHLQVTVSNEGWEDVKKAYEISNFVNWFLTDSKICLNILPSSNY